MCSAPGGQRCPRVSGCPSLFGHVRLLPAGLHCRDVALVLNQYTYVHTIDARDWSRVVENFAAELPGHLVSILDHIRHRTASTRPELERVTGLSRKVVAQRVEYLIKAGLIEDGPLGVSTGGRMPRQLRLRSDVGTFLVAELNTSNISVALTNLNGDFLAHRSKSADTLSEPDKALALIERLFDEILATEKTYPPVWAICVGVILPVDRATGRPVHMPFLSNWGGYPVAERLTERYGVHAWVQNEVNLMALGELRSGMGRALSDFIFVKVGGGIGAGIVAGGALVEGAQGGAGEIGHMTVVDDPAVKCWCGNTGCLMQLASGIAIVRLGTEVAQSGVSAYLADVLAREGGITPRHVVDAAAAGDQPSLDIILRAGQLVGKALAGLVNIFNPSSIIVGGSITSGSDIMLAAIRRTIYERALPMSTRELRIEFSPLSDDAGLVGAAAMALDELFAPTVLQTWIENGSPVGATSQPALKRSV